MSIKPFSLYSQKLTTKELNHCKKAIASSKFPTEIALLNEKIKFLEAHCQQFKKLHVEWKTLNHHIDQKVKNLASAEQLAAQGTPQLKSLLESKPTKAPLPDSREANQLLKQFHKLAPYAGLGLGTLTGLVERFASSRTLDFKDKKLVKKIFEHMPVLQGINLFKQNEIKNFSLLMPLLPLAAQVIRETAKGPKDQKIAERLKKALITCATVEQRVYVLAAAIGMLGAACYPKEWAEEYFDPSGHIMLKTLLTTLTAKTLSAALSSTQNRPAILGSTAIYTAHAITDAILIHTTVSVCHTVPELAAGFAAALTISALAKKAIGMLQPVKL